MKVNYNKAVETTVADAASVSGLVKLSAQQPAARQTDRQFALRTKIFVTETRSPTNNKEEYMVANEADLRALMRASLRGDAVAYRTLLGRLSANLRAYYKGRLARIGRSATEAEDLTQEALMAIHTRRHTYDPAAPLMPWVHAIARYKLIDHLRHTHASMKDMPIENAEDILAQDDHIGSESAYDLNRLLAKLPDKMRRTVQMVKLDGLSVAETASQCGMSESDVKISVHRGLKALVTSVARKGRP